MNIFDYMQDVGRPIAYYPRMAHFFGSVNASIMFSQLFYWQDRTTNELGVYKTAEEWTEETGLSYREQATARAHLVKQGFLIETHKRIEHRIYYKLNRDAICHAFDLWRQGQKTTSDESAIPERRKRNSGTTIPQSGECAIRNSGTTIPQPVYKTETTAQTTTETTAETFPPVAVAPVAGPVFPPIDDTVVEQAKPAPVGTVAVVEAAEVVEHTPTAKPKRKRTVVDTGTDETALQAACRTTWAAYSGAYAIRYGVAPLRNAKVNAAIKGFVQRIGHDESPAVAAYYVSNVNDAFVVRNMHDTGLLLKQAEGYRTQWATGRSVTATAARQADQTAANMSVVEEAKLIARARRAAREAARLAGEDFL